MSHSTDTAVPDRRALARGLLFIFALPAVLQGFLHAPAQSLLQGIYAKHVGLPLAAVGIAVLIARIVDALVDPLIGAASDAWRRRNGSYKPFIAIGTIVTVVGLWNLFRPGDDADVGYFALWYIVASIGWSITEIPYKSWSVQLSSEYVMRTRIQTWIAMAAVIGTIAFYLVPYLARAAGYSDSTDFNLPALAFAAVLIGVGMPLVNFFALWKMPEGSPPQRSGRVAARDIVKAILGNRPLVYFTLTFLLSGLTAGISQGVNYLYVDSYLGLGRQLAGIMLLAGPVMLLGIPIWGFLCQVYERQKVWAISLLILAACQAAYAFVPIGPQGLMSATMITVVLFFAIPCIFVAAPAMVGDLIDFGVWKFRQDHTGSYIAVFSIVATAVNAMGAALGLILLDWLGYDATATEQTTSGVAAMKMVAAWIPAFGTLIAVPLVWRYPLNRASHARLVEEIESRGAVLASNANAVDVHGVAQGRQSTQYPVHADYRRIPSHDFKFGPVLLAVLNAVGRWDRRRKSVTPIAGIERTVVALGRESLLIRPITNDRNLPIVIYYHGGAFAFSYGAVHIKVCEQYALKANVAVLLVSYRLAPKHPFPHGFDDCFAALLWVRSNASELGIDSNRVAVMGDSAGGAMAAGVAQKALDQGIPLRAQVLIYPVLDSDCKTESMQTFLDTPLLNAPTVRRMWAMYLKGHDRVPVYAAPGLRNDLRGLPPTYIDVAEFDPLRDEGLAFADELARQGVPVTLTQTHKTIHGFEISSENPETLRAIAARIDFLKAALT